ncbi:MAG: molybdopterin-synthase adenylyltransferase MoeB [Acidobacteriota bacterium]
MSIPSITTAPSDAGLTGEEIRRYGRHLVLPHVGLEGQKRLKSARVLLVGAGGLGSPASLYLAAAGVGTLGLVDFDRVDASNLQRLVLYGSGDVGRLKVEAAIERLGGLNPHVRFEPHEERLRASNARQLVSQYDLVVDGSDNAATRYLVNDACVECRKPDVWGAVLHFEGQLSVFGTPEGPCYRCLFPEPPPPGLVPSCAEGGVLGVLPGILGSLQASEAIKLLLGVGEPMIGRFLVFDALRLSFRELQLAKNPNCPACAPGAELTWTDEPEPAANAFCTPEEIPMSRDPSSTLDLSPDAAEVPQAIGVEQLAALRSQGTEHVLLDVREPQELEICRIEGSREIPLGELPQRFDELDKDQLIVVHCHHGGRSHNAVQFLRSQGYSRATNLTGGIDDWSLRIDSSVPRY